MYPIGFTILGLVLLVGAVIYIKINSDASAWFLLPIFLGILFIALSCGIAVSDGKGLFSEEGQAFIEHELHKSEFGLYYIKYGNPPKRPNEKVLLDNLHIINTSVYKGVGFGVDIETTVLRQVSWKSVLCGFIFVDKKDSFYLKPKSLLKWEKGVYE